MRIALAIALMAAFAFAGPLDVYSSSASYDAAAGPQILFLDFTGPGGLVNGNSFSPLVTFGSPEAVNPALVVQGSNAITDAGSTFALNNVGPLNGVFSNPVAGFGFDFISGNIDTVDLYDAGGGFIGSVNVPTTWPGFFGVISMTPIKSFQLNNALFGPDERDRFFIDNFRANAPIPEPSIAVLLSVAAAGLWFGRRRK